MDIIQGLIESGNAGKSGLRIVNNNGTFGVAINNDTPPTLPTEIVVPSSAIPAEITVSPMPTNIVVTGATSTTIGTTDRCIQFPYSGTATTKDYTFTTTENLICDILVIGGGGGGGKRHGGGGGAGTLLYHKNITLNGTYNIKVGKGGTGVPSTGFESGNTTLATSGIFSQFIKSDGSQEYYANGGGRGGGWSANALAATNGGRTFSDSEITLPLTNKFNGVTVSVSNKQYVNTLTSPEGCRGNVGGLQVTNYKGGGGGGAGGVGMNHDAENTVNDGYGGIGLAVDITGTSVVYAGGGNGSDWAGSVSQVFDPLYPTIQSRGGGGFGSDNGTPQNGLDGTGGGGGAQGNDSNGNPSGNGGSGIVIIRYRKPSSEIVVSGIIADTTDRYIQFPYSGTGATKDYTFTTTENLICDILVVGGGGGGGKRGGGGGGAGACLYHKNVILNAGTFTVGVGKGGLYGGTTGTSWTTIPASPGGDSSLIYNSTTKYRAKGGGGGQGGDGDVNSNTSGGSSGGGNWVGIADGLSTNNIFDGSTVSIVNNQYVNTLTSPEGCRGNIGGNQLSNYKGGGGGGAGSAGMNHDPEATTNDGYGGLGLSIDIIGTPVVYAGGGNGCDYAGDQIQSFNPAYPTIQSRGGGGYGSDNGTAQNGLDGTGGGGGGQGNDSSTTLAGSGGSGIVIIRYRKPPSEIVVSSIISGTTDRYISFPYSGTGTTKDYTITTTENLICDVLVVGGGGCGGRSGGGGGAVIYTQNVYFPSGGYSVKVGNGGISLKTGGVGDTQGANGSDSDILFGAITIFRAKGGGFGAANYVQSMTGGTGGSGGGSENRDNIPSTATSVVSSANIISTNTSSSTFTTLTNQSPNGITIYGNRGGLGGSATVGANTGYSGGGGGGAGGVGGNFNASTLTSGAGGAGISINITGSSIKYGSGGASGIYNGSVNATQGTSGTVDSGGGTGAYTINTTSVYGSIPIPGRGGGGGGWGVNGNYGGAAEQLYAKDGGSGVIIIRYRKIVATITNTIFSILNDGKIQAGSNVYSNIITNYVNPSLSNTSNSISGTGISSQWTNNGTKIYYNNTSNVGIGTTDPITPLHIYNDMITTTLPTEIVVSPMPTEIVVAGTTFGTIGTTERFIQFPYSGTGTTKDYTFTTTENLICDILIVGGGGAGGTYIGGGGGAGGVLYIQNATVPAGTYNINVGKGGTGFSGAGASTTAQNGSSSKAFGIEVFGGGFGGAGGWGISVNGPGQAGGSGGSGGAGGSCHSSSPTGAGVGGSITQPSFTSSVITVNTYNYYGGTGATSMVFNGNAAGSVGANGGGGAGGNAPANTNQANAGAGADGIAINIIGTSYFWGGGGGGGQNGGSGKAGNGGKGGGGGGNGSESPEGVGIGGIGGITLGQDGDLEGDGTPTAGNGGAGTGGGGGGSGRATTGSVSGAGGSGIVIIRYRKPSSEIVVSSIISGTTDRYIQFPYSGTGTTKDYTFTTTENLLCDILIVGGGGAGGTVIGGGGGSGSIIYASGFNVGVGTYTINVGRGGIGATATTGGSGIVGGSGGSSSAFGATAIGGGGGGWYNGNGGIAGGSGGGCGGGVNQAAGGAGGSGGVAGSTTIGGTIIPTATFKEYLCNNGGFPFYYQNAGNSWSTISGGGGGVSAIGGGTPNSGSKTSANGDGGAGKNYNITGTLTIYGGGGGGGSHRGALTSISSPSSGAGGSGGGGAGADDTTISKSGFNGIDGTGGGGGGSSYNSSPVGIKGGNGGSGVIIIRYRKIIYSSVRLLLDTTTTSVATLELRRGTGADMQTDYRFINDMDGYIKLQYENSTQLFNDTAANLAWFSSNETIIHKNTSMNGRVGIGTTFHATRSLDVIGDANISGSVSLGGFSVSNSGSSSNISAIITNSLTSNTSLTIHNGSIPSNPITSSPSPTTTGTTGVHTFMSFTYTTETAGAGTGQTQYTINVPTGGIVCDILVVGGGGGGARRMGGGGGAGALIYITNQNLSSGAYTIKVGNGGAGSATAGNIGTLTLKRGSNGFDSEILFNSTAIFRAKGGGGGLGGNTGSVTNFPNEFSPLAGGSGGGNGGKDAGAGGLLTTLNIVNGSLVSVINNSASDSVNPSYVGGFCFGNEAGRGGGNDPWLGSGGGGAGSRSVDVHTLGNASANNFAGVGGIGLLNSITGTPVYYAGGGGGGNWDTSGSQFYNDGGLGGGGRSSTKTVAPVAGQPNTGGGGGGDGADIFGGAMGGSGIIIIRYLTPLITSSSIELIRGTASDSNRDYKIGNYNSEFKVISSTSGVDTDYIKITTEGAITNPTGTASWNTGSDRRIKENIEKASYDKCYDNINKLELNRFNYIEGFNTVSRDNKQLGFIAQEVYDIFPKAISSHGYYNDALNIPDLLSIDVSQINYSLYGAVKKLIEINNEDEKHLSTFENRVKTIKTILNIAIELTTSNLIDTTTSNLIDTTTSNLLSDTTTSNLIIDDA
jgi:hypothetical protein